MGHTRVGVLPQSRKWNELRDLIRDEASAEAVGAKTLSNVIGLFGDADVKRFGTLAREPVVVQAMWALMTLPALARGAGNFESAVSSVGLQVPDKGWESPVGFVDAVVSSIEQRSTPGTAATFGDIALVALRQTLLTHLARSAGSLFETSREEIRRTWSSFGTSDRFGDLAQTYLASLLERSVQYYVSREVPQQLGGQRRFADPDDVDAFNRDVSVWCRERAAIAEKFASAWLSKEVFTRGRPTPEAAARFVGYALAKVGSEVSAHQSEE